MGNKSAKAMSKTVQGEGGLDKVVLKSAVGTTAEVYLHGAHVTSFKSAEGHEFLFVSSQAVYKPPKAIRGGIPVCFPQFGDMGPWEAQHGFARNSLFAIESQTDDSVTLFLKPSIEQMEKFPGPAFELRVEVTVGEDERGETLKETLQVKNVGDKNLSFTCALHTYYNVTDISKVEVLGFKGLEYLDSLKNREKFTDERDVATIGEEVDRIYMGVPQDCSLKILDGGNDRCYSIDLVNFPDGVFWNPWIEKAAGMGDFGDEEYKNMVCLEPAVAASGPVEVAPNSEWAATQTIKIRKKK
eukprot:TRINITY_DN46728_c0_g1_i1.p1 TRINITY_DN46728_c0_g1~~TRINITY_DN46728_c0_g1_i1.p1  ORF type:complete len:299 (+),score=59.21 TRINITY_DN46728_c0_g1_i1:103-999(+)